MQCAYEHLFQHRRRVPLAGHGKLRPTSAAIERITSDHSCVDVCGVRVGTPVYVTCRPPSGSAARMDTDTNGDSLPTTGTRGFSPIISGFSPNFPNDAGSAISISLRHADESFASAGFWPVTNLAGFVTDYKAPLERRQDIVST